MERSCSGSRLSDAANKLKEVAMMQLVKVWQWYLGSVTRIVAAGWVGCEKKGKEEAACMCMLINGQK